MEKQFKIRCSQIGKIMGNAKVKGELSQTCKSYLHKWYANDNEQIYSKYMDKGNFVEDDLIKMATEKLNLGFALKNTQTFSDEYFIGTCDVKTTDLIVDVKASWNNDTLQEQAFKGINSDYEWQLRGYCHLYQKPNAILFFGLLDTPEDVNYNIEISFQHIPEDERWIAFSVKADEEIINEVIERVKLCREYLVNYDKLIKSKLGKIN